MFVHTCVYRLHFFFCVCACIYWVNVYIWYVHVYIQSVCICRVYSYFFPLMFLSLSMNRSSQVTNTEAWKGFYTLYRAYNQALFCADLRVSARSVTYVKNNNLNETAAFLKLSHDAQNSHNLTLVALILRPTLK